MLQLHAIRREILKLPLISLFLGLSEAVCTNINPLLTRAPCLPVHMVTLQTSMLIL